MGISFTLSQPFTDHFFSHRKVIAQPLWRKDRKLGRIFSGEKNSVAKISLQLHIGMKKGGGKVFFNDVSCYPISAISNIWYIFNMSSYFWTSVSFLNNNKLWLTSVRIPFSYNFMYSYLFSEHKILRSFNGSTRLCLYTDKRKKYRASLHSFLYSLFLALSF